MGMAFQNLVMLIASLCLLVVIKTDITLYLSWAVMGMITIRSAFAEQSASLKSAVILIQGLLFALGMWYVFYPDRMLELMVVLGLLKTL